MIVAACWDNQKFCALDPQLQGSYGPAVFVPGQLYGISANRTKLYDTTASPSVALSRQHSALSIQGRVFADCRLIA